MTADDLTDRELMFNRFRKLLNEVIHGVSSRHSFAPWELEILLDMETCDVFPRHRVKVLRQYEKAVERQLAEGPGPPMKLSEFLAKKNKS